MTRASARRKGLEELATLSGVELAYRNIMGERVVTTDVAIEGVLSALGVGVESDAEVSEAIDQRRRAEDARLVDPVVVLRKGRAHRFAFIGPLSASAMRYGEIRIRTEEGRVQSAPLRQVLSDVAVGSDGRYALDVGAFDLDIGYHSLTIESSSAVAHAALLVRPGKAKRPRRAFGVFAPLYGLRSANDWGIGSTSELAVLGRWAAAHGATFVGTLPLYPAFYEEHFDVSPYRPVSRVAWNEIYLDVERLPEVAASSDAAALLSSQRLGGAARRLRAADGVQYRSVFVAKKAVIAACANGVERGPRADAFGAFLAEHPEIRAYARFRSEMDGGTVAERAASVRYYQYGQFAMDRALTDVVAGDGIPLYLDLPLGVHPEGFDRAHYPGAFISGASIGAPPDDFFVGGQNWGIPPLDPQALRAGEFGYVVATFRHVLRHARVLRIDHVMGLERCFVIPDGCDARDGAYVRYPSHELRAIVAIEADRAGATIVGEDLGTVPPQTRAAMRRDGMLRAAVFEIEGSAANPAPETGRDAIASFGTHDLPRFVEFIEGGELASRVASGAMTHDEAIEVRKRRRTLRTELERVGDRERGLARAYRGVLAWLGSAEADLALVDLGDLLLDPSPENRPGPDSVRASWRHRIAVRIEDLVSDLTVASRIAIVAAGRPTRTGAKR